MYSFLISIILLIIGYFTYGKYVSRVFSPEDRETPAIKINDGVDYIPMPIWKVVLIQLLNIAGTGPIFGALSGALFGPIVYIWIVLGCIFAGAVHDYLTGMISLRHDGMSISELTGIFLGKTMRNIMRVFSVILLVMCGVVFTTGPAGLLNMLWNSVSYNIWIVLILVYYFVATFVPIDKIIGRIYPLFGLCLIIMAIGVGGSLILKPEFVMPEIWDNFKNLHPVNTPVFPFMLITVACGAISGFHATQTPMMARCLKDERDGQKAFYLAMILEGIIALVWAAAGVSVFKSTNELALMGGGNSSVVYLIANTTMGKIGSILAIIGVVICPLSSGDTAYRSARLTIADSINLNQSSIKNRLLLTLPLLLVGSIICRLDYTIVWRYFSWSNQTLATIALWTYTIYLLKNNKIYHITLIPALFMSTVVTAYFICSNECLGGLLSKVISFNTIYILAIFISIIFMFVLYILFNKHKNKIKN